MENIENVNDDSNKEKKPDEPKSVAINSKTPIHQHYDDDDEEDGIDMVKRYVPVAAIGSFLCSHCIVEAAKNYVLSEFPEISYVETHLDDEDYDDEREMTQIAMKCLTILVKKFTPQDNIFFLDANQLVNNTHRGTIFIGRNFEEMTFEESKIDFIERTKMDLMNLQVFNKKEEKNKDNLTTNKETLEPEEHAHEIDDELEIGSLTDVYTIFTEKANEDDKDDYDRGHEAGLGDGIDSNYEWVKVALYKMFKMKKIKNLDFLIEEINNTIMGMGVDEFNVWKIGFLKYTLKRQQRIEKEEKYSDT